MADIPHPPPGESLPAQVAAAFRGLQDALSAEIEAREPAGTLREERWDRPEGGGGITRAVRGGNLLECGGVNFSRIRGAHLPGPATERHPEWAGLPFEAMGVSVVLHPRNPFAPTSHLNVRAFFLGEDRDRPEGWWFGGGFDLSPTYGFPEDAVRWHEAAARACTGAGLAERYRGWKRECDRYFSLPHRGEQRGIGGIFFDDLDEPDFATAFALARHTGDEYRRAYFPLLDHRSGHPYTARHRAFQELRRGRYVEFNLLYDRGTRFGLLSGGRTASILVSLPARVRWDESFRPEPGSPEETLTTHFLQPRQWLRPGTPPETEGDEGPDAPANDPEPKPL